MPHVRSKISPDYIYHGFFMCLKHPCHHWGSPRWAEGKLLTHQLTTFSDMGHDQDMSDWSSKHCHKFGISKLLTLSLPWAAPFEKQVVIMKVTTVHRWHSQLCCGQITHTWLTKYLVTAWTSKLLSYPMKTVVIITQHLWYTKLWCGQDMIHPTLILVKADIAMERIIIEITRDFFISSKYTFCDTRHDPEYYDEIW